MDADLPDRVAAICKTAFNPDARVLALSALPGGAENHAFTLDVELGRVMRRAPAEEGQSWLRRFAELLARLHGLDCARFAEPGAGADVEAGLDAELVFARYAGRTSGG